MCGRFALTLPLDAVAGWFDAVQVKAHLDHPRYNICPSQQVPVLVNYQQQRQLVDMRWGFIPRWYKTPGDGPMLINARSETIAQKPAFRAASLARRCLIPAVGFYEWERQEDQKLPWYFRSQQGELMAFAGIWQAWQGAEGNRIVSCATITAHSGEDMADIHHREPVVIQKADFGLWLGEEGHGAAALMHAAAPGFYHRHRVGMAVNSGRSDTAELIEPLAENKSE